MNTCTHRMGGSVSNFPLGGNAKQYSVITHRLPSGGLMALCTRCLKEWHPINFPDRKPATPGWEDAIHYETTNFTSESGQFAITEQDCQRQIENWVRQIFRYAAEVSKLETEVTNLRPPTKFYDRLKFAIRILRGN